jgi:hypothetical protein
VSQLLLFGASPELRRFVEAGYRITTIQVRARVIDSDEVEQLTRRIEERLSALPERLQGRVTGTSVVLNRALEGIIRGQALSVAAALGIIYVILALLFLSVRIGLIALVPNVIPVAAYFGALAAFSLAFAWVTDMVLTPALCSRVRTWVSRQEGEVTLELHERGESVGEVGFFQGEHATHCDVEEEARMLRLSGECLEQLGRRHPRVAATLHGNLNKTLAARLALRTRESALDDAFFRVPAVFRPPADGGPGGALILDPSLSETLAGLGIRTETLAALTLIPLVRVAWADEHLDEEERRAVLRGAESVGIAQDSPGHELLRAWLEERPDPRIFEAWRDFVAALCARLSIEGQLELREDLLGRAREVAEAAGGFLGVRSISRREETVLRELESVFPV